MMKRADRTDQFEDDSNSDSEEGTELSNTDDEEEEESSWISWFCNLKGNEFFVEVDEDYIQDDFNLTGLSSQIPFYDQALDTILDMAVQEDNLSEEQQAMVESAAEVLYGLIHARYILTSRGMQAMMEKYKNVDFGRCPRLFCQGQAVLPVGTSDVCRTQQVMVFCPRCEDVYVPRSSRHSSQDGAFWGTTFPHLFFMIYSDLKPSPPTAKYEPRIYGFRIYRPDRDRDPRNAADREKNRKVQNMH